MQFHNGMLHFGGVSADDLAIRFGTPLYVYEAATIRRQTERIKSAFAALPLQPFYAMKANDSLAILRLIRSIGFGCDCVSPGEIFLARHAGFSARSMWFTSSNVSDEDLLSIDDPAIVINVNSMTEIERCVRLRLLNPLAIRVNPEIGAGHHRDVITGGFGVKFGVELAAVGAARELALSGGLPVVGLHAHIGSGIATPEPLMESARRLVSLIPDFPDLRFVNFGGGIAVPYRPGEPDFPIDTYGSALAAVAGRALTSRGLTAIVEPGRYVVAEAGTLVTRVTSRRMSSGYEWIGCDTGFNHLVRPSKYGSYHHIVNASAGADSDLRPNAVADEEGTVIVAGNLCESGDVFTRDTEGVRPRSIGPTKEGDLLAICDAGAYGFSMASRYNARPLPAEVTVDEGVATLIRQRQSIEELLNGQL
jgi:diaminopimelate decarboxylase